MTDLEVLTEMLARAGVVAQQDKDALIVEALDREDGANLGYNGFVSVFYFTAEGSLEAVGTWE